MRYRRDMSRDRIRFERCRPGRGFVLAAAPLRGTPLILPAEGVSAGLPDDWPRWPLGLNERAKVLQGLAELPFDEPEVLLSFAQRHGRFGTMPVPCPVKDPERIEIYGERVGSVILELIVWHGARELKARLDARRSVDQLVESVPRVPERWRLKLPLPPEARDFAGKGQLQAVKGISWRMDGGELVFEYSNPIVTERGFSRATARKAARRVTREAARWWLDELVTRSLDTWSSWEHRGRAYQLRIDSALGMGWHYLATGPSPRFCKRPNCPAPRHRQVFQPPPTLRSGEAFYHSGACARWGQRHGIIVKEATKAAGSRRGEA